MTNTQVEEITSQLSDFYYETITNKVNNDEKLKALVAQLKQEGYSFEPLQNDHAARLYDRLMWVRDEKPKAVDAGQYEHAHDLRDEEIRLLNTMVELAYFTTGIYKTIIFLCARQIDEWVLK